MIENVVISKPKKLERTKKLISEAGAEKLHILTDFDRTLTTAFVDGKNVPSIISVLREGNYLTPDYAEAAKELYAKYHPAEINPRIPLEEKKKMMKGWWTAHFDLLIKSGLNKKDLRKVVDSEKIRFRDGFGDFVDFLQRYNIPLVIISSSGLGDDNISMCLEKEGKLYNNIHIISNSYEWDKNGNAISINQPIIHGMNKDETVLRDFPVFDLIKNRKNILLIGDSLDDVGMVKGSNYDNLIKIAFLNENVAENLEHYKRNYDVIILNDSSMYYINNLLKEMIK